MVGLGHIHFVMDKQEERVEGMGGPHPLETKSTGRNEAGGG